MIVKKFMDWVEFPTTARVDIIRQYGMVRLGRGHPRHCARYLLVRYGIAGLCHCVCVYSEVPAVGAGGGVGGGQHGGARREAAHDAALRHAYAPLLHRLQQATVVRAHLRREHDLLTSGYTSCLQKQLTTSCRCST